MSLSDWERNGWLVQHRTNRKEIADLLGLADRDLRDRAAKGIKRGLAACNCVQRRFAMCDSCLGGMRISFFARGASLSRHSELGVDNRC